MQDKLDEYIGVLEKKIIEIKARDDVDVHKAQVIKDEIILANASSQCAIPIKSSEEVSDENLYNSSSVSVYAISRIDKPFITSGSKKEIGGVGRGLVYELNFTLLNEYLRLSLLQPCTVEYRINRKDILDAIDKLNLPDDYIIIETGDVLNSYDLRKRITFSDSKRSYDGHEIINLGTSAYNACIWVMRQSDCPFIEIVDTDTDTQNSDFRLIDENNYLYSNIDNLDSPYDICLVQSIKVYSLKDCNNTCKLKPEFDSEGNSFDLDKVTEICPDATDNQS